MDKSRIERLIASCAPDEKTRLTTLYNGSVKALRAYQEASTASALRNWQAAEAALEKAVDEIERGHSRRLGSQTDAAREIGCTPQHIHIRVRDGTLAPAVVMVGKRKRLDLDMVQGLLASAKDPSRGRKMSKAKDADEPDEGESYSDLRKRTERYKAKLKRLDYKIRSGQYVERVRVERTAYAISRSIRDAVLSIGPRLAPVLAAESDLGLVGQILDRELNLALADLAGYVKRLSG
jgi:hypothetical protein